MSPAIGRLRSRAWAFQMGRSQMTESGSTAAQKRKNNVHLNVRGSIGLCRCDFDCVGVNRPHGFPLGALPYIAGAEPNLCAHQDHVDYYAQRSSPLGTCRGIFERARASPILLASWAWFKRVNKRH